MNLSTRPERYCFGNFELLPDQRALMKDGAPVSMRPRAFDLLVALVERAGHLVAKDELLNQVWSTTVVEEAALHVQVSALRKVIGTDAITTVSGRGYQFTLPVTKGNGEANRASGSNHNLPYSLTSFIGRDQETAQLEELVTTHRLVTLTGAGGAGKTRLALEVASRLIDAFPDGVWLVELAALSDPRLVPRAMAEALALKEQPGNPVSQIVSGWLASKRILLVVDNVEHLIDACARLLDEILRRGRDVAILVTSRERLGMTGELTYRVPSLTVPETREALAPETAAAYEGVRLFVERTKLVRPDFALTANNAACVASICARLDGMPLAIELAVPCLRSMSIDELHERLDRRFTLLTDGSRALLSRHRTLRSVLDWSYDLLTDVEQALLRRVSVFADGWKLAFVEQVSAGDGIDRADVLELMTSLVDKSLVISDEEAGATRYRMLETVRQYALDRLRECGEEAQWRARHLTCFVSLADDFRQAREGPNQQSWVTRIANELDNLRAALAWSVESSPSEGLRLAADLDVFWRIRGHLAEGREWLARLLDAVPVDRQRERTRGFFGAGMLAILQGDCVTGRQLLEESLAIFRELGDSASAARVLGGLAWVSMQQGDYPAAEAPARESVDCARATGDRRLLLASLGNLAIAIHRQGRWASARELLQQALALARELGAPWEMGNALHEIARTECDEGRHDVALEHFAEGLTILHGLGDRAGVIESLEGLAGIAAAKAAPRRATRLWAAADGMRKEIGHARSVDENTVYKRQIKPVRMILSRGAFDQAWEEGRAMSLDDAVRYALNEPAGHDL